MLTRILLIDPDSAERERQLVALIEAGFDAVGADGAEQAFQSIDAVPPGVVICDAFTPGTDGFELIWQLSRRAPEATVLVTSAPSDREAALDVALRGAHDYLERPLNPAELRLKLRNASERGGLRRQNRLLHWEIAKAVGERPVVAASSSMISLLENVERAASGKSCVLLTGESGTGKEIIARVIHGLSSRRTQNFIPLQCAVKSEEAISAELFGVTKPGVNTENRSRRGLVLDADRGTLFLDEVGSLPLSVQDQILRALAEEQVESESGAKFRTVDLRIIAATTRKLEDRIENGSFREGLYQYLDSTQLHVPALRERREDIPLLVDHFLDHYQQELAKPPRTISEDALALLVAHHWPGNIRELENVIEAAVMLAQGDRISIQDLPTRIVSASAQEEGSRTDLSMKRGRRSFEIGLIRRALRATGGNRTHAAKRLEISHRALLYKIKEYEIGD
ncbi:MAG: sigma-54-dependent Fis family transcriptional regulator [Deltaproteobacteria bacterium]|jgi:two-component system response regulator AtoC|nr:sigma-54-dependent Fis family transcriptional regulator [Deltaproteobacteria bacterium]